MISVIIPAHNEARAIDRCLGGLVTSSFPADLQIIVVPNGCTDDTAQRARSFPGVQVLETPEANKAKALNIGDSHAVGFPRFYVDADIEIDLDTVRGMASLLNSDQVHIATPRMVLDLAPCSWPVRGYYSFWSRMPYARNGRIGGAYGLSEAARHRFDTFPDLIADDLFVRSRFVPSEIAVATEHHFTAYPPRTLLSLLKVRSRVLAGNAQLRRIAPAEHLDNGSRPVRSVITNPRLWPEAALYTGVHLAAKIAARWKLFRNNLDTWERDETARTAVGP